MNACGLDLARLVNAKHRGGKIVAQCPACAASGADKHGEHLVVFDEGRGRWGCAAFAGDKEHRRQIAAALGSDDFRSRQFRPLPLRRVETPRPPQLTLPLLRAPTIGELAQLADVRGLPFFAGCELAVRAGQLRFADMTDASESVIAWVLLDSSRRCAQARRLDGKPWHGIGDVKAKTLPGSQAAWPIGAADIGAKPFVAFCEGSPDFLAAWSLAWWHKMADDIAPVCMAGSHSTHADALPLFANKGVWLFPHRDAAGERARRKWTTQLLGVGALWVKPFDVAPHGDLNEWLAALRVEIGGEL